MSKLQHVPKLLKLQHFRIWADNFYAFLATENLSGVLDQAWIIPVIARNATQDQIQEHKECIRVDERVYGYILLAMSDLTSARKKVLQAATVIAHPCRGSILFAAVRAEALSNPHRAIYDSILTEAQAFRQPAKGMSLESAIETLDQLWASIPDNQQPDGGTKKRQLKVSLLPHFSDLVKQTDRTHPAFSYDEVCAELIAFETIFDSIGSSSGKPAAANYLSTIDELKRRINSS